MPFTPLHDSLFNSETTMKYKHTRVTDYKSSECSGCGLCEAECPVHCITMQADSLGYIRPQIDDARCIDCGLCARRCIIVQPMPTSMPLSTYAAVRKDSERIGESSSGGVFATIAESLMADGWLVAGCVMDEGLVPRHVIASDTQTLRRMYGSKYVQSDTRGIYAAVKKALADGYKVLFSGTPCQVAAVKRHVGEHDSLATIEVICHGVPNLMMFHSSLHPIGQSADISSFVFRDKAQGWTFNSLIVCKDGRKIQVNHRLSSYMTYFLEGETYRDSCYACPYASVQRGADITIGDFWGVVGQRPDLKDKINVGRGVSCMIVNTEKGMSITWQSQLHRFEVSYDDIRHGNEPLNHPSRHTAKRKTILSLWAQGKDWSKVDAYWRKHDLRFVYYLWSCIPTGLQHRIRLLLGKR